MKTLQERLRYMHEGTQLANIKEAADRIDELEADYQAKCAELELVHTVVDKLQSLLKVALEAQRCECSADQACEFARERDEIDALRALQKDAERYQWLVANHNRWSWNPTQYNHETVSGFTANGTWYSGHTFVEAIQLAMYKAGQKEQTK